MAWLAVNKNGQEVVFNNKPSKCRGEWCYYVEITIEGENGGYFEEIFIPKGSIKKLIGKDLTWDDEPIEI